MESKDIGPCTVCMIGSSLDMILDVTTEEIGLLHELESSFLFTFNKLPAMVSDPSNTENNYQGHLQVTVW